MTPSVPQVPTRASRTRTQDIADDGYQGDPIRRLGPGREAPFPKFLAALGGAAFEAGTAWHQPFFAVVALWLPPGAETDTDLIVTVLTNTVEPAKHRDVFACWPIWKAPILETFPCIAGTDSRRSPPSRWANAHL
jgi:hypothetical protein